MTRRFHVGGRSGASAVEDRTESFETSWILRAGHLAICRALISLYIFLTLFFVIGWTCTHDNLGGCNAARRSFSYFTVLTYWGLAFYFLVAALRSASNAIRPASPWHQRLPRPFLDLHSFYYSTIVTLPLLVTIVYWAVLYRGTWFSRSFDAWRNLSQHALNSLFALFEILVPSTRPLPWLHLPGLLLLLLGYLAVAFITVADQGFYPYHFLDHDAVGGRGHVAAFILGIAIGMALIFCVVHLLIRLRCRLTPRKSSLTNGIAQLSEPSNDVEMDPATGFKKSHSVRAHADPLA